MALEADYRLVDWTVRPRRDCLERGGKIVHLSPKTNAVLQCLAAASGEVVTRQELFDAVWPGCDVTDDALTQRIAELRKAFQDSAHDARFIETIPKIGFRLIPPVMALPIEPCSKHPIWHKSNKLYFLGFITLALILALYLAGNRAQQDPSIAEDLPSVAVLPFVNLSGDPEQEYFSDGVSEEILNMLSKVYGLKVISRSSSFAFKNKNIGHSDWVY